MTDENQTAVKTHNPTRRRHAWLYALPEGELPPSVRCDGRDWRRVETFKHDFFAATGVYAADDGELSVLKIGRVTPFGPLPLKWIGALLMRHEVCCYAQLQDVPGVPRLIGCVGETGFLHAFVPGHALERQEPVSDSFFDELEALLATIHARGMAYVDLNKRQNILHGADGRPYLVDFQISLLLPSRGWRRLWPVRWFLGRFQNADRYHFLKHKRRLRPDLLTELERARAERLSIWIRLHRLIARPLTQLRRRLLARIRRNETVEVAGASAK